MAAAARLAAMKERIKNKDNAAKKEKEVRVAEMCKRLDTEEAEEKVRKRAEMIAKLAEEAKAAAAMQAAAVAAGGSDVHSGEPGAKRVRVEGRSCVIPKCSCVVESVRATVEKPGPHFGRPFFKCIKPQSEEGCSFFVWEELLQSDAEVVVPQNLEPAGEVVCICGLPAKQFTVKKEGPNCGRTFHKCPEEKCKFFAWAVGNASASPTKLPDATTGGPLAMGGVVQGSSSSAPRQCRCGTDAQPAVVRKEGPNTGRTFWKCGSGGQCKFFEWDSAAPAAAGQDGPTASATAGAAGGFQLQGFAS